LYICVCNAYTDRQILAALREGGDGVEDIYRRLGSPPNCRRCLPTAQELIDSHAETRQCAIAGPGLALAGAA
jgi:bacterioferritin-associated ferredoxin